MKDQKDSMDIKDNLDGGNGCISGPYFLRSDSPPEVRNQYAEKGHIRILLLGTDNFVYGVGSGAI